MTRILVADDDRNLVDLVRAMLDEAGFEALVATRAWPQPT